MHRDSHFSKRDDLKLKTGNKDIESIFIEITLSRSDKKIIIGCVYRPPDADIAHFNDSMTHTLELINKEGKMAYILGDYNIDLLKCVTNSLTLDFLNNLYSNYFFPIITEPTRVTDKSATLIDNILTNSGDKVFSSGTLCVDISDHFPVFQLSLVEGKKKKQFPDKVTYRKFNGKNITSFKKLIDALSWENVYTQTDVNCAYKSLC